MPFKPPLTNLQCTAAKVHFMIVRVCLLEAVGNIEPVFLIKSEKFLGIFSFVLLETRFAKY